MSYDLSTDTGLAPVLMFHVIKNDKGTKSKRGCYLIPQRGIGMIGVPLDGSVRSLARHLSRTPEYIDFIPGVVDPGDLDDEDGIIKAISKWMIGNEDVPTPEEKEDEI